jgi:putative ABC transport system permease protein
METLFQDLRYAVRMLLKSPAFTLVAVVTIALGIGANTTIFSAINAVVLAPFSYPNQDRLVILWERNLEVGIYRGSVAPANFFDWRDQNQTFEQLAAISQNYFDLTDGDQPERFAGYAVSPSFFDMIGVKAAIGRTFRPEEDQPGRNQVVVLKHSLWKNRFGGDASLIDQTITLNNKVFTVIGVMPEDFNYPFNGGEMWAPITLGPKEQTDRASHYLQVLGLLKPGATVEQAAEDINSIALRAGQIYPESNRGRTVHVISMTKDAVRGANMYSPILMASVGFVLLIACANVANLLLVRATTRQKEVAIRLALGAGRVRMIRQLLTESLLLAMLGGGLGLLLSLWGIGALAKAIPENFSKFIPGWQHLGIDKTTLVFTLAVSLVTGLIFGLVPALQATKMNFNEALKEGGKGTSGSGSHNRARNVMVISEIALSLILLIGAGLMIRSFVEVLRSDFGVNPTNVLSMQVSLPAERYAPSQQRINFFDQLISRVSALPGVSRVGAVGILPMSGNNSGRSVASAGQSVFSKEKQPITSYNTATPGYFEAVGTELLRGRGFTEADRADTRLVALVNEAFVSRFFADQDPIGQQLKLDGEKPLEIIGVVANIMNDDMDSKAEPNMYVPYAQNSWRSMFLVIRATDDPARLASAVRSEVSAIDKTPPVFNVKTLEQSIDERISPKRLATFLIGFFAIIALLLAAVGLYAVMSYAVTQRTHEIGIRMALGAQAGDIFKLVVGQGFMLTAIGLTLGLAGAFLMTRAMAQILYNVTASDPLTFIGVSLLLAAVALFACYIPARKATKVDPMVALRYE